MNSDSTSFEQFQQATSLVAPNADPQNLTSFTPTAASPQSISNNSPGSAKPHVMEPPLASGVAAAVATAATTTPSQLHKTFETIVPQPINVPRSQTNGITVGLAANPKALQYSLANLNIFQSLPTETARGVDDMTRMYMALISEVPNEVKWSLKKYLSYSNKAPYMLNLKNLPHLLSAFKEFSLVMDPLLEKLDGPIMLDDTIVDKIQSALNSLLILRNLAQDTESVQAMSRDEELKRFLLHVIQRHQRFFEHKLESDNIYLSNLPMFNELMHYTIDLVEALSTYMAPARKDDLFFNSLMVILTYTKDRYLIISILRSLSRLLVRSKEDEESAAENLDEKVLNLIVGFLLVDCDTELIIATTDFLYQYILPGNRRISKLLSDKQRFETLCTCLPHLLSYNVKLPDYQSLEHQHARLIKRMRPPPPTEVPTLEDGLFQQILALNEPARSTAWLRCCFEPVREAQFTQIALWRAYEAKFASPVHRSGRKLLPAVEFIKNVSNAFRHASAMVVTDPTSGEKKFVIRGIQPRSRAVSIKEGEVAAKDSHPQRLHIMKPQFVITKPDGHGIQEILPARQEPLVKLQYPKQLSDVAKAVATFLCLLSNDNKGVGIEFCQRIEPVVLHKAADIPPLSTALSEYLDNTRAL